MNREDEKQMDKKVMEKSIGGEEMDNDALLTISCRYVEKKHKVLKHIPFLCRFYRLHINSI